MMKNILYLINVSASSTMFVPLGQLLLLFTIIHDQHFRNLKVWEKQHTSFLNIT